MTEVPRWLRDPGSHCFLFGPRGTGKTTWLRRAHPDALWIDLLDPATERELTAHPESLRQRIEGDPERRVVVIDEIQRAPHVLTVVHQIMEERPRRRRFILTGSSARKLKRAGVDLLGGRALKKGMHPFMASELGSRFNMGRALSHGLVPGVWDAPSPAGALGAYLGLYTREEVKNGARVFAENLRGLHAFRQDYPAARVALLYRGRDRLRVRGIPCLPCGDFLAALRPDRAPIASA